MKKFIITLVLLLCSLLASAQDVKWFKPSNTPYGFAWENDSISFSAVGNIVYQVSTSPLIVYAPTIILKTDSSIFLNKGNHGITIEWTGISPSVKANVVSNRLLHIKGNQGVMLDGTSGSIALVYGLGVRTVQTAGGNYWIECGLDSIDQPQSDETATIFNDNFDMQRWTYNGDTRARLDTAGDLFCRDVPGLIFVDYSQSSTDNNDIETTLWQETLDSFTLDEDGESLIIYACGQFAANANEKQVLFYFGSDSYTVDASGANANSKYWVLRFVITREDFNNQVITGSFEAHSRAGLAATISVGTKIAGAQDLETDVIVKITAINGVASDNDILLDHVITTKHSDQQ